MAEEVLICPFCGAPHKESIPAGVVQVKCHYCGADVLVPPRLGGTVRRCPNHPETLAVGLCNDCGNSFCDQCLYVWEFQHGRLNLCSECYKKRSGMDIVGLTLAIVFSAIVLISILVVLVNPLPSGATSPVEVLIMVTISLGLSVALFLNARKKKPLSVRDFWARTGPRAFMKKCVNCGEEIPIASEQCQYCDAAQPEHTS